MSAISEPSLLTCVNRSRDDCAIYAAHGYTRLWFQVQNGGNNPEDFDFAPVKSAGMIPCVWGVTYAVDDAGNNPRRLTFHQQNEILGKQAVKLQAESLMVDAEDCLKFTRNKGAGDEMIAGVRAGGWPESKPVHLTTLGAPNDPAVDDYEFDLAPFLRTGGGIFIQAYAQMASNYRPDACMFYYHDRLKVPKDRLNAMIWIDYRIESITQARLVKEAGFSQALSVFMAEYMDSDRDNHLTALDPVSRGESVVDSRLTLDPRLVQLRDTVGNELSQATSKDPEAWKKSNPREYAALCNWLLYRVLFDKTPPPIEGATFPLDPPQLATHIGKAGSHALQSGAAQAGRLK